MSFQPSEALRIAAYEMLVEFITLANDADGGEMSLERHNLAINLRDQLGDTNDIRAALNERNFYRELDALKNKYGMVEEVE